MRSFLKTFFAALVALVVFSLLLLVIGAVLVAGIAADKEVNLGEKAVLVVDLSQHFADVEPSDPISELTDQPFQTPPSLSRLIRLIKHAKEDNAVRGLYIKAEENANDLASSEELRQAILDFRSSGKWVYAYGHVISQGAYYVANAADRIYCNPVGGLEWRALRMQVPFIKGMLQKLDIEPQIFYAGKFKSATEPLRETQMTEANRLQSLELLSDVYETFLMNTADTRKIDTATLRALADSSSLQFASVAAKWGLIDAAKYDDEVKEEIRKALEIGEDKDINFVTPARYLQVADITPSGRDKIAVIYAEGNIIDGKGERGLIGGDSYKRLIRKARSDKSVKAIVLRVNSGGGSSLASEVIWREVYLARQTKPVIVSFGDAAASGGYYISCAADSIFAQPNTITGSIGVFTVVPNMQKFFGNKLGITFDEVSTSRNGTPPSLTAPLTPAQRLLFQHSIDTTYEIFKRRVAEGRKLPIEVVDSIAQGRVWSGKRAVELKLVDRLGGLQDAIDAAAAKAGLKTYRLREYPAKQSLREMLFGNREESIKEAAIKKELGQEHYKLYKFVREMKASLGKAQARMPFALIIE